MFVKFALHFVPLQLLTRALIELSSTHQRRKILQVSALLLFKISLILPIAEQYSLVFWPNEDSVTVVPASSIKNRVVGEITEVAVKKEICKGKVIALGKCIVRIQLLCNGVTKHHHITFSTI